MTIFAVLLLLLLLLPLLLFLLYDHNNQQGQGFKIKCKDQLNAAVRGSICAMPVFDRRGDYCPKILEYERTQLKYETQCR